MELFFFYAVIIIEVLLLVMPWVIILITPLFVFIGALIAGSIFLFKEKHVFSALEVSGQLDSKKWNVLIADDDDMSTLPLLMALTKEPVSVTFVENGKSAAGALNDQKFDLVFLDTMLPDMKGYDLLSSLDKSPNINEKTPVIVYTSCENHELLPFITNQYQHFDIKDIWQKKLEAFNLKERLDLVFCKS